MIELEGLKVLFGMPVRDHVHPQTEHAMDHVRETLLALGVRFAIRREDRGSLPLAHSLLAMEALRQECTHLFLVHSDVAGFTPDDVVRILRAGEDIVGGPIPGRSFNPERIAAALVAGVPPELAWQHAAPMLFWPKVDAPPAIKHGHLIEVDAMSTGFLCVSRRALLAASDYTRRVMWGHLELAHVFEEEVEANRQLMSEDRAFCMRCAQAGIPTWADLDVALVHWGSAAFHAAPLRSKLVAVPTSGPRTIAATARFDLACPVSCEEEARSVLSGVYDLPLAFDMPPHVLDLGANVGAFARWALVRWPRATVDCYEPQPGEVLDALRANRVAGMEIDARAVIAEPTDGETRTMWVRPFQPTGSHLGDELALPGERHVDVETIDALDLADADIVKVDIEGDEPRVLARYFMKQRRTRGVVAEWHVEAARDELAALLEGKGFRVIEARASSPDRPELGVMRAVKEAR